MSLIIENNNRHEHNGNGISIDQISDGNTSFLRAARAGNLEKVLEHLKNNIDINTCNANGLNALHLASKDGHVTVVSELLSRGALVDAATKKGNTALHIASLAGQEEVVKLLIQHNASVNVQSQNGFTPLYMAAQENHDSVVKFLLANGANQSLATEDGFTPLAVAMQQGHDKVVTVLLESDTRGKVRLPALHIAAKKDDVKAATLLLENDHNPDVTSKSGFTPLHIASHYGNEAIANLLIQKGADVNYAAKHNISPLHVAAKWGKTNMVGLLLEKGANIESKTRDGLTPLHCAARSGHEQVVDMLLERGAPISSKTKNGLAPLHMAAQGEHVDAARILLYHRAPVDEVTVDYLTALHVAAHCGHVRVAKLLLDRNADANARALNGFTPLHIACKKNRIKVVELLLKHGASISATTESGLTPLHVASFMGCMNIVIYLLQHEASPDVPTVRGETPLHLAARANQTDIIRILLRNGAQVDARAREQQTPLHIASRLGNVDIVMLLLQHGAQVDAVTKDMYTALHIAAKEGQDEVAAVLLDNGAQIDAATKKGFTPLHLTAKYGNIKVAQLLLTKEAPVDAQGKNGVTPLHVASHYDHQNVALLLLEKGASVHATAKNGHTPLHIAARKNQMDIATTLLEYGAQANTESKAGFTPLHLSSQEGHTDMSSLLLEHKANPDQQARNGLTPLHLCAQEDKVQVAQILVKHGANIEAPTKAGYTPLHVAAHFGQANMVRYLIEQGAEPNAATSIGYTPLHQAAQQGHLNIVHVLIENKADPNAITTAGQTPLHIAQKLGYISVFDSLKPVTNGDVAMSTSMIDEKYRVVAPEAMHETFMSDSEEEGEDTALSDQPYRYLTVDEMKSLGDDSLPIDVTRDERVDNKMMQSTESAMSSSQPPQALEDSISPQHITLQQTSGRTVVDYAAAADNVVIDRHPQHVGFLVSFLVDARGGAMRGCRHSGVRIIVPARSAAQPTRITCRYVKPQRTMHPPPLMEGEALASRVLELGPVGAKFLGPVIMEVPHFASLRGKEREIVILRSDNGETWREHTIDNSDEIIGDVLNDCFDPEDIAQMDELGGGRICRFVTYDFPQYFAVISRIHQEVHAIGPEGGMVSSTVVPQVQAVFPQGALTKKIKVGLQAQPIDPDLTAKLLGRGVAVSPVVTVEPRRRKFHKAITLSIPTPRAHSQGMINQYSGNAPTLRLLCSITGGTTRAQWEDVTGSTPLTFVNDCVSFTTTVSARFWLMDCRNIADATKMATELYREAIHVPFMAKFVVFAKRVDPMEARLRVFCMTDDREDKTLEQQEHFTEVAKSRDVEVLENKVQYLELAGNLVAVTKSGDQLQFPFKAFKENRLPFSVRVKDQHADTVGRALFMREPKVAKGESPQSPICILNIVLPEDIIPDSLSTHEEGEIISRVNWSQQIRRPEEYSQIELRTSDISNLLSDDWVKLAPEIGISQEEIEAIVEKNPNSTAQQAQAMLKLFQTTKQNDINILENGLRSIHRDDIVDRCLQVTSTATTTTTQVIKRHPKRTSDTNGYEENDMIKDSDSLEELTKKRYGRYTEHDESKYSAEEKVIESEEDDDEAAKKTVAERREKIVKRLSGEQKALPSAQKKEIVEEIITIKRQSLIDDARAKHEDEILMQKPTDNSYKSTVVPEQIVKLKTSSHDSSSVDKSEFDKELQDRFQKTLGDVDKFEHKYEHESIPSTQNFLASEISSYVQELPEKSVKTVTKTTTIIESSGDTNGKYNTESFENSAIVTKRETVITTFTDEDGYVRKTKSIFDEAVGEISQEDFECRQVIDPNVVDEILEEARKKADSIQSNTVTKITMIPGETKETITTTTRTIESINLDDVSGGRRDFSDDDEELIQNKKVESLQKSSTQTPPSTPLEFDGLSSNVQQLPDQLKFGKFASDDAENRDFDRTKGDDDLLNSIQIEAITLVDSILEESLTVVNNNSSKFNPSSFMQEMQHDGFQLSHHQSLDESSYDQTQQQFNLPLINVNSYSINHFEQGHSEDISDNFAIKSDCDIIVKSPTIESMSGKSFEDVDDEFNVSSSALKDVIVDSSFNNNTEANITPPSSPVHSRNLTDSGDSDEYNVNVEARNLIATVLRQSLEFLDRDSSSDEVQEEAENLLHKAVSFKSTEGMKKATVSFLESEVFSSSHDSPSIVRNLSDQKLRHAERKFEHLSSEFREDPEDPDSLDFDQIVNKDDISTLQNDFSKISWDESLSANTTGDFDQKSTPDNDLQDVLNIPEPRSHPTKVSSVDLPKPTPRLTKESTNETNNSLVSSDSSTSLTINNQKHDSDQNPDEHSDVNTTSSDSFQKKKQFWESFDHPILPHPIPKPRIAGQSFDTDATVTESAGQSIDVEDRLEDESFPISERYDSDASEQKDDRPKKVTPDKIERFDSSESEAEKLGAAKFYIGEISRNVIKKSIDERRNEFAFDNQGYEISMDGEERFDFVHGKVDIYEDNILTDDERHFESHLMAKSTLEEKSDFEVSEKLSRQQSEEKEDTPMVSFPIKNETSFEMEKPLEIAEEHVTCAKATAIDVVRSFIEPEAKKPLKLENITDISSKEVSKETFRIESSVKRTEEEFERTLEEVQDSLNELQEELIEVVKDGKSIKQSPSEFEINILPDLKYPASIPEQEELPDTPKKESTVKIKTPETIKIRQSEAEESQVSSADESFNKLEIVHRQRKATHDAESSSESRPLSSDVENLVQYQSCISSDTSVYDTAESLIPGSTLEYHSAISSRDSMKSLDSESSGNLASVEASEASETLVPSTMEECEEHLNNDLLSQDYDFDDQNRFTSLESETASKITKGDETSVTAMKRSHEMTFLPDIKPIIGSVDLLDDSNFDGKLARSVEDLKYGTWDEHKLGTSLEEGSMLSVSISSASNLETMVEVNVEQAEIMGSLVGSFDSAKIYTTFPDDPTGVTTPDRDTTHHDNYPTTIVQDQDNANQNVTSTEETTKKRGHKRTDSTIVYAGGFIKAGSKESSDSFEDDIVLQEDSSDVISSERDETHGESSDSEFDRYETEYARSFRTPGTPTPKSKPKDDEKKLFSPGQSVIETIDEDFHAEIEDSLEQVRQPTKQQVYDIPNIQVTQEHVPEEEQKSSQSLQMKNDQDKNTSAVQYAKQVEYKMTEEEYQDILAKKYESRLKDFTQTLDDNTYEEDQQPSPGSDSFEMLNEPDLSDEFVIVEEVAKEAHEFDQEGKSLSIARQPRTVKKHDEEMEKFIVKSAPAATDAGSINFEFENSSPQDENGEAMRGGNGYSLEGSKRWVEMNLSDPANLRYPYDTDRGILEDIKEEDTDFEIGSSRISSFKDSYSSTPDYEALVRKINSRDHDNISMNSLQEFESLEQVISLENRQKATQSSQESLSNGSFPKRSIAKGAHGDDISLSSLKEFEGLENACLEAHLIEIRAKEEAALLLSRSDDSNKSSGSSTGAKSSPKSSPSPGPGTKTLTTTVVTSKPSTHFEHQMAQEFVKLQQRAQEIMEDSSISIMEASADSLEEEKGATKQIYDKTSSQHVSSDSLDNKLPDPMTSSIDSIEAKGGMTTGKSSDLDSIENNSPVKRRSDSIDSIELQFATSQARLERDSLDGTINYEISSSNNSRSKKVVTQSVTKTFTSQDAGEPSTTIISTVIHYEMPKDISSDSLVDSLVGTSSLLLTSTESMESSSTNATYRNSDSRLSQMTGSMTSCDSHTIDAIDTLDSTFPDFSLPSSSLHQIHQTTTSTTTYAFKENENLLDDDEQTTVSKTFIEKFSNP